jgi:hypothetical protein
MPAIKWQVAETVSEAVLAAGKPTGNFISGLVTQAARESDEEGLQKMEVEQQVLGPARRFQGNCTR